jgi:hypothetical protein
MAKTLTVARFTAATVFLWRAPSATYGGKNDTCVFPPFRHDWPCCGRGSYSCYSDSDSRASDFTRGARAPGIGGGEASLRSILPRRHIPSGDVE